MKCYWRREEYLREMVRIVEAGEDKAIGWHRRSGGCRMGGGD